MKIKPSELMELGYWGDACEVKGINEYAVNEGLMDSEEEITFNMDEIWKLIETIQAGRNDW